MTVEWSLACMQFYKKEHLMSDPKSYRSRSRVTGGLLMVVALTLSPIASSQDRDRDRERGTNRDAATFTTLERGTVIPVRTNEAVDVERRDNRVYTGIVDQDVRGDDGRLAIPRGAEVEL